MKDTREGWKVRYCQHIGCLTFRLVSAYKTRTTGKEKCNRHKKQEMRLTCSIHNLPTMMLLTEQPTFFHV